MNHPLFVALEALARATSCLTARPYDTTASHAVEEIDIARAAIWQAIEPDSSKEPS